jgi:hypothetical protein
MMKLGVYLGADYDHWKYRIIHGYVRISMDMGDGTIDR